MREPTLTKLELRILEVLWARGNASIREIQELFPEPQPAYTTIQTTVYRLEAKKAVRRVRKISNAHIFEPIVARDVARHRLLDEILSFFGGRAQPMMAQLAEAGKLTREDVRELEKTIEKLEKQKRSCEDEEMKRSHAIGVLVSLAFHVVLLAGLLLAPSSPLRLSAGAGTGRDGKSNAAQSRAFKPLDSPLPRARDPQPERAVNPSSASNLAGQPTLGGATAPPQTTRAPWQGEWRVVPLPPLAKGSSPVAAAESGLLNHLWQSTLFAVLIGLITLAFRKNDARVRYWLWLAASVKFLVPFSVLAALGANFPLASAVEERMARPFASTGLSFAAPVIHASPGVDWLASALLLVWIVGMEAIFVVRFNAWRRIRVIVRSSMPASLAFATVPRGVQVRTAPSLMEPGVVGFWRPVLLLPGSIHERLTPSELQAVVEHEVCHARYKDNLTAALHMLVEMVFWFHPLVWWIGGRMLKERERACDEAVLRAFGDPRAYADGIVNVCKEYLDARLACVPGVSSSDLRQRIERIMKNETGAPVPRWKRVALGVAAALAFVVPVAAGALNAAPRAVAQVPPVGSVFVQREAPTPVVRSQLAEPVPAELKPSTASTRAATSTSVATPPAPSAGVIKGQVSNTFGEALEGVVVDLTSDARNVPPQTTRTDASGAFELKDLPPGNYSVVFTLDEYETFKREGLSVGPASDTLVNPRLREHRIRD